MKKEEFDKFADEYLAVHRANIRFTGEDPEFFARYKIDATARLLAEQRIKLPSSILDFGCGIGNSLPHLAKAFPSAEINALDVSERSLEIAGRRFPGVATFICARDGKIPLAPRSVDLIFSACVFHHIDAAEHISIFASLRKILRPHGRMVVFEHNPINPVTQYIVATCEFDENAVLIPANVLKKRQQSAGFSNVRTGYTGFFPRSLKLLRPLEPYIKRVPFGAQYYTLAYDQD